MSKKQATLCFVKCKDKILMINRLKAPFMGMWNAIGGKLKDDESIEQCAIREVFEESGLRLTNPKLFSTFTWNYDDEIGHALLFELKDFDCDSYINKSDEGVVLFMPIDWIINQKNYGVIEDLKVFINDIKNGVSKNYHLVYEGKTLKEVIEK